MNGAIASQTALNAICPYFTMFPLDFPKGILDRHAKRRDRVLDPFCGRGTTNFAARLAGLDTLGIDSSPVATAITAAKLANTSSRAVIREAMAILTEVPSAATPNGEFWRLAYHSKVLHVLCRLRIGLLTNCASDARLALRGIILGALHGPLQKGFPGYFSNQCTRTYAPKPRYATKYWRDRKLRPPRVDVIDVICRRVERYFSVELPKCRGNARLGDSRKLSSLGNSKRDGLFDWVITSPPYYGMRTYIPDQWLRYWFLGGSDVVSYSSDEQLEHASPQNFVSQLAQVWENAAQICRGGARLVIRFGGISDRKVPPLDLVKQSLHDRSWRVLTIRPAGTATSGKRQADSFLVKRSSPIQEYDVWAALR
jgi:DNA methylase